MGLETGSSLDEGGTGVGSLVSGIGALGGASAAGVGSGSGAASSSFLSFFFLPFFLPFSFLSSFFGFLPFTVEGVKT